MKAINRNGKITVYASTPSKLDGQSKHYASGFNLLTEAEQKKEGLFDVVVPDYNSNTQELGDIYWDSANTRFTYPVNSKTFSQSLDDLKATAIANLKSNLQNKLAETDWYYIRKYDKNTPIPSDVQTDRDNLRTSCNAKETAINALTEKSDVVNYDITL